MHEMKSSNKRSSSAITKEKVDETSETEQTHEIEETFNNTSKNEKILMTILM